ncbi:MAG: TonB-dependent receptor [Prevotellaceae bacterium]|nr:TonB-dependent receptor [Prevotellaceae bacterium]
MFFNLFSLNCRRSVCILLVFCGFGVVIANAQNLTITGKVLDVQYNAISGVTVTIKGATKGTMTNEKGEYSLSNVPAGSTLDYSLIGYVSQEVKIKDKNEINVIMEEAVEMLEDVTIVTFGKQKTSSVVSSITSVKVSDLRIPASNLTNALAGRVAGLISYQTSGEPGADNAQFFVRGINTFGQNTSPLILIDGFESTADELARLRPDDIESFSLMKDAAGTVMYGARSANGILSITTKSGREGSVKINARFDVNVSTPTRSIEFLDGVEYMRLYNEAGLTRNPTLGTFYDEQKIQATAKGENPMVYPNVNWYDNLFNKATVNEKAHVDVSGGGQVANYFVSGGFEHETGLLKVESRNNFNSNIDITRVNLRSNVVFKLSSSTTLDTRISGRFERYTGPYTSTNDLYKTIMWSNPVDFPAVFEPDEANRYAEYTLFGSTMLNGGMKVNPYAEMVRGYQDRNESNINLMATLTQKLDFITESLTLQLKASINSWSKYSSSRWYSPKYFSLESYDQVTGEYKLFALNPSAGNPTLSDVFPTRDADGKYHYEAVLNWGRKFGLHDVAGTLVGLATENLLTGGNSLSIYETLPEKNLGLSGRLSYNFDERYFAEFIFGYNGSEKFTGDKRYGFFPAAAAGWMISNEKFFEPLKNAVSTLKLKASVGKGGNDAISGRSGRFFFLSDIELGGGSYRWGGDYLNSYSGYNIRRYANPNITWEESLKYNYGFELGLFKDAAVFQIEYFQENRSKIYLERENLPRTAGIEAPISGNVGKVESHGIDASIEASHSFNKDFWVQGRANFTYATNKYVELDEKDYPDKYLKKKGYNINQQWGLIAERLFVDEAEIRNSPEQTFGEYMAGDIKYRDVNGDGTINDNDRVAMGFPTVPEIQYGFGLSTGFKNFDFSFFFQGNARVSMFINSGVDSDTESGIAPFVNQRNALPIVARDYWSEINPNVHAFWPRLSTTPIDNNTRQSSWWLRDISFLRLKSMEIGYNMPFSKKIGLENCRLYFSGENLLVFSAFKLWDPEMGRKGLGYPPNKRFNIGLQLSF